MSEQEDNISALNRLRALPRGTQVDSRIAAIQALLGEKEIFKTLHTLRWPQGVVCPRCYSTNVVRRDPPPEATDQRYHYECLNCKGRGHFSDFDDLSGLPMASFHSLRQWVLCWYLIGFCSIAQIAKVLGLSIQEILQMAAIGSELPLLPQEDYDLQDTKEESADERFKKSSEYDEVLSSSASRSPFSPKYKSRK